VRAAFGEPKARMNSRIVGFSPRNSLPLAIYRYFHFYRVTHFDGSQGWNGENFFTMTFQPPADLAFTKSNRGVAPRFVIIHYRVR